MYFSYVPSIIFSFFNRPFFLNLLFKQILIQSSPFSQSSFQTDPNSILFNIIHSCPYSRGAGTRAAARIPANGAAMQPYTAPPERRPTQESVVTALPAGYATPDVPRFPATSAPP